MKANTGLCIALCGGMLAGCSSLTDGSLGFHKTPPRIVMTADSEYQRGKQFHLAGRYSEAQTAYLSALAIDPGHGDAKNGMAALVGASGDLERAIGMLVELAQRQPQSHVYANLGHAYQMRGRLFEARDAYQRAVELDPGNDQARRKLAALEQQLGATAVVEAPATVSPEASASVAGAIDLVTSGVYAMRYPTETMTKDGNGNSDLLNLPATSPVAVVNAPVVLVASPNEIPKNDTPPASLRKLTVELVNGNGVTGLARQLKKLLPRDEWNVVRTANHSDFWVRQTRIEYVQPHKPAARRLAEEIGVRPALRSNDELTGARLRVVLGHDLKDLEGLRQRLAAGDLQPAY